MLSIIITLKNYNIKICTSRYTIIITNTKKDSRCTFWQYLRIYVTLINEFDNNGQFTVRCFLNFRSEITYIVFVYWLFDYFNFLDELNCIVY